MTVLIADSFCQWVHRAGVMLLIVASLCSPLYAKRKDVVVMKNGDRLTGEVKKLEHGQLFIEVEYVAGETVAVDWLQVARLESVARYRARLENGTQLTGIIEKVPAEEAPDGDFRIEEPGAKVRVAAAEVVEIQLQKRSFWRQLKGSVDVGQSYTSGNGQLTLNLDLAGKYTSPKYMLDSYFTSSLSGQSGSSKTRRYEFNFVGGRFLSRNNLAVGLANFLHSSQQSLDLRTTVGGGYGRYFINSNRSQLGAIGGLVYTKEIFTPSSGLEPRQQNVEGLIGLRYSTFQINKVEFETTFQVFPGITDAGRVRSNLNSSLTFKFAHDLHLRWSFWDTFDSKPPVNAKKNELGVSTTFGFSF